MSIYDQIIAALVSNGISQAGAERITEFIVDYGWNSVRDALNQVKEQQ